MLHLGEPQGCASTPEALTTASRGVLTMAEYIVAIIKGAITLLGGRAFFECPLSGKADIQLITKTSS